MDQRPPTVRRPLQAMTSALFLTRHLPLPLLRGVGHLLNAPPAPRWERDRSCVLYVLADLDFFSGTKFSIGGHVAHINGTVSGLITAGYHVHVLTNQPVPHLTEDRCTQHIISKPRSHPPAPALEALPWNGRLADEAFHIAQKLSVSFVYQRHAAMNFSGGVVARKLGVPFVLEVNSPFALMDKSLASRILCTRTFENVAFHLARWIVTVSDESRSLLLDHYTRAKPDTTLAIPNGVNHKTFSPDVNPVEYREQWNLPDDCLLIGFSGNFKPWHGIDALLSGYRLFRQSHPGDSRLVLIGLDTPDRTYEMKAEQLNIGEACRFLGPKPFDRMPGYLAGLDVLVSPQVPLIGKGFHGSPTKLFEYMAMGKPIIASRIGQMEQVIRDGRNGLLVTTGSAEEIRDALLRIAGDADLAGRLGARARRDVLEQYTWDRNVRQMLERMGIESS